MRLPLIDAASCGAENPSAPRAELKVDPGTVLSAAGAAGYAWDIASDEMAWTDNARAVVAGLPIEAFRSGQAFARAIHASGHQTRFDAVMTSAEADRGAGVGYQIEYALTVEGSAVPVWIEDQGRWYAGPDGKPARAEGLIRVITERHNRDEQLSHLSRYDGLTGELNKTSLTEALEGAVADAIRFRSSIGFLLIAVDHIGRLNEAFGFDVADQVICAVGQRIRARLRNGDVLGRFSGNKFGVILMNCGPDDLTVAADRLLKAIRDDVIPTRAGPIAVTASIGGMIAPRHAQSSHDIIGRAHEALDQVKINRRGAFLAWRSSVEREARRRLNIRTTDEIISALNGRRVMLAFEPVIETASRRASFYECLVRFKREDGEILHPSEIIPVAERLGLIRLIDHRVLELVVEELLAAPDVSMSLNISPETTMDPDWWGSLEALIRSNPDVAGRLIVEITETVAIENIDLVRGFVTRVKDLGARIAIDDFGAGYTSFRNIRMLGVDIVKVDGAFVQNITRSAEDRIFVEALLGMARRLGLGTVAEWVQDEQAATLLADWGCDYLQGSLVGLANFDRPWMPLSRALPLTV